MGKRYHRLLFQRQANVDCGGRAVIDVKGQDAGGRCLVRWLEVEEFCRHSHVLKELADCIDVYVALMVLYVTSVLLFIPAQEGKRGLYLHFKL